MTRSDFDVFTVRLPAWVITRLRDVAESKGMKPTELAREIIIFGIANDELIDLLRRLQRFAGRI